MFVVGKEQLMEVMDYLKAKNFVSERNKREDGSYEVKFESYG